MSGRAMSSSVCLSRPRMDGVVGALEQPVLAVLRELEAGMPVVLAWAGRRAGRAGTTTDAVMSSSVCTLSAATKSCRSLNVRQAPFASQADAQVAADQLAAVVLELVPGRAVDDVDAEVLAPVVAPLRPVEALDDEDQRRGRGWGCVSSQALYSGVKSAEGREQLDHRAERALGRQDRPRRGRVVGARPARASRSRARRSPGPAPCPLRSRPRRSARRARRRPGSC